MGGSTWVPPQEFEEFRLLRRLGAGSMGQVFLAQDTFLDRPVAIKFLVAAAPNRVALERFLIEARAAARVQHPNVVGVYRAGDLDGRPYLVSEYIRGESLDRTAIPISSEQVGELALGLACGLAAAHRQGVLHRDIKPANVVLTPEGTPKLVDFGVAKLTDELVEPPRRENGAPTVRAAARLPSAASGRGDPSAETQPGAGVEALPPARGCDPSLTGAGTLLGTPLYLAPEVWLGEPTTPAGDVYSLGAMLYELCAGAPPHRSGDLTALGRMAVDRDAPPLGERAPGIDPELAAIIHRCLARDPVQRYKSGEEVREALERIGSRHPAARVPEGNPYLGLRAFDAEHRAEFFGRGMEVRAVLERLRHAPLVIVAGDSGVGKSSLCRAGVLPLVDDGALEQGRAWSASVCVPGPQPIASLATALAPILPEWTEEDLSRRISSGAAAIIVAALREKLGETRGVVLFVDQLEELVTLSRADDAQLVSEALVRLAAGVRGLRVLATVRGDLLTRLVRLRELGDALMPALYLLRPLSPEGVREAIVGPARSRNVGFESDAMVDALVETTSRAEGALPLLQFALAELWEARDLSRGLITTAALEKIGGVEGALARHADGVLLSMTPEQRAAAREVLTRLGTREGTRVRCTEEALVAGDPIKKSVLEVLIRGRLVIVRETLAEGSAAATGFEVAHEALLRGWATLRAWIDLDAGRRLVRDRLSHAAAEWARLGGGQVGLWSEEQLSESAGIERRDLGRRERAFIEAAERAIRRRRWRRGAVLAGIPIALLITAAGIRHQAAQETAAQMASHLSLARAEVKAARSVEQDALRLRQGAFTAFDALDPVRGEERWDRALQGLETARLGYERAAVAYDRAHALDPQQHEARVELGEVYYALALLAERTHRLTPSERQRLELYDEGGALQRRWNAPAQLELAVEPAGASVRIARYAIEDSGPWRLVEERTLQLSGAPVGLAPGSYLLTLSAPGRAPIRYPLYLARAEKLRVELELPASSAVPEGFALIPEGRFFFGSRDEEARRSFFRTAPVHQTQTGSYLIARHETTYAQWIEYLEALPEAERAKRMPRVGEGLSGDLVLQRRGAARWELSIHPGGRTYVGRSGEPILYARASRASQDWLRFPVTGISWDDAEAYVGWLRKTQRVPGARLCSEKEWERGARGADARRYPHGATLAPDDANYDETYGKVPDALGPDEVGAHPISMSPFGLQDMAGNAFEWVRSSLSSAPDEASAIRSGSYYQGAFELQVVNREPVVPSARDLRVGLRVCASWPP
ncbi:MAG: SUMF1/EgtB/PvdO family nonheme iron enzyme [Deltaproteobacteria bacterium]|nr:SUMF1/EgtB/PvdO family nonheme iron enzyme [Deltaproteobacteria bacterium]